MYQTNSSPDYFLSNSFSHAVKLLGQLPTCLSGFVVVFCDLDFLETFKGSFGTNGFLSLGIL
jgi:hypothetical protein